MNRTTLTVEWIYLGFETLFLQTRTSDSEIQVGW